MWPFGRHISLEESGVFRGFTDCHSHILPGVDDGVRTMEESLEILAEYEKSGICAFAHSAETRENMIAEIVFIRVTIMRSLNSAKEHKEKHFE